MGFVIQVYFIMAYQPTPFSLIMPEVPAWITDGNIASLWHGQYINSIQMDPYVENGRRCQRVTIHFDDFSNIEIKENITNGYYKTNPFHFNTLGGVAISSSYLLPCDSPNPKRTEYSHIVAFQLQDLFQQQTERIEIMEDQIVKMKTIIQEGTNLQLDINESNKGNFNRIKTRLDELNHIKTRLQIQEAYSKCLEDNIATLQEKHNEDMLIIQNIQGKLDALTEWCAQSLWKRTSSFVYNK